MEKKLNKIVALFLLTIVMGSCVSKKEILYFQDVETNTFKDSGISPLIIEVNDILSVKIGSPDISSALPYNPANTSGVSINNLDVMKLQGNLVSADGTIVIPVLGVIQAKGKTVEQLERDIVLALESGGHLIDPTVSVRVLNPKITVLGEVKAPGTYTYTEQQISILQALGYAGDLTINGKRKDVMLIREEKGKRIVVKLDLTKPDFFDSKYYYVRQNDIIYVSPNKAKVFSGGIVGNAATVLSAASVILSAVVIISNN